MDDARWVTVGRAAELRPGTLCALDLDGTSVAVARLADGSFAAFDEWCTHEECPLSEGELEGTRVVCFCHGAEFDVVTGTVLKGPATDPVAVYETRVDGGELRVLVPRGPGEVR